MLAKNYQEIKAKITPRIQDEETNYFPEVVLIDNISYCNLRCSMCPHKEMKRKPGIMNYEIYKKIIDEISIERKNARIWISFFGEGLILKDLGERIKYAKSKGLTDVVFNTNANLLTEEKAEELIRAGLDVIYVGIDAFYEETYNKLRVGGNLEKVRQGVLAYKKILDKYGTENQKVFVQFVEMDINKDELEQFIEYWNSESINVKVRPMVSWGGKIKTSNLKDYEERLPCNWGMNTINITDTGLVCLCSVDLNGEVIMGDIKNDTIKNIWNNKLKEFRLFQINGEWDKLPDFCKNCRDWQSSYAKYIEAKTGER